MRGLFVHLSIYSVLETGASGGSISRGYKNHENYIYANMQMQVVNPDDVMLGTYEEETYEPEEKEQQRGHRSRSVEYNPTCVISPFFSRLSGFFSFTLRQIFLR